MQHSNNCNEWQQRLERQMTNKWQQSYRYNSQEADIQAKLATKSRPRNGVKFSSPQDLTQMLSIIWPAIIDPHNTLRQAILSSSYLLSLHCGSWTAYSLSLSHGMSLSYLLSLHWDLSQGNNTIFRQTRVSILTYRLLLSVIYIGNLLTLILRMPE